MMKLEIEIQKIPVRYKTRSGRLYAWVPVVGSRVIRNPNDEDGLFWSLQSATKGIARHLARLGLSDQAVPVRIRK